MTSKYHSIGTAKQQAFIERLAREKGYAQSDVDAALRWLAETQSIRISSSKLGKQGLDPGRASELIDYLQEWVPAPESSEGEPATEPEADRPAVAATVPVVVAADRLIASLGRPVAIEGAPEGVLTGRLARIEHVRGGNEPVLVLVQNDRTEVAVPLDVVTRLGLI